MPPAPLPYLRPHRPTCGPAALPAAPLPYQRPRRPTSGPAALPAAPPPYLRPRRPTSGPATLPAALLPYAADPPAPPEPPELPVPPEPLEPPETPEPPEPPGPPEPPEQLRSRATVAAEPQLLLSRPSRPSCRVAELLCCRAARTALSGESSGSVTALPLPYNDLQLFLQCDRADGLSLFDLTFGASPAPAADADATIRS
ncbi:unnamed protein product, partial [Closterium sp. NIES-64]